MDILAPSGDGLSVFIIEGLRTHPLISLSVWWTEKEYSLFVQPMPFVLFKHIVAVHIIVFLRSDDDNDRYAVRIIVLHVL